MLLGEFFTGLRPRKLRRLMSVDLLQPTTDVVSLPMIDLSYLIEQMRKDCPYSEWSPGRLEAALEEYRRFWALCKHYPQSSLGISADADKIWHRHILNTRRYAEECKSYLGFFLHHTPVFDESENEVAQMETNRLWLELFGETRAQSENGRSSCVATGCMNNG